MKKLIIQHTTRQAALKPSILLRSIKMGICYRALLCDEFNWEYDGFNRSQVIDQVKSVIPNAVL